MPISSGASGASGTPASGRTTPKSSKGSASSRKSKGKGSRKKSNPEKLVILKEKEKTPNLDAVQGIMGSMGRYQLWVAILIFLVKVPMAQHELAMLLLIAPTPYACNEEDYDDPDESTPEPERNTCPCDNPRYFPNKCPTAMKKTIISQSNLICDRKYLKDLHQMLFQFGTLCGSILFGILSDRYGRRKPLIWALFCLFIAGISAAYTSNFWLFTFLRFIVGVCVGGVVVVSFVLLLEYIGRRYRECLFALYQVPFNMGHISLSFVGYYWREYNYVQKYITLPILFFIFYICLLPESPKWLLAVHKTEAAIKLLTRIAVINRRPTTEIREICLKYQHDRAALGPKQKIETADLLKRPRIRSKTICMAFQWAICSYCFYGLAQYVGQLDGDVFLNIALSGVLSLTATLLSIPLMAYIGRKTIIIGGHLLCAACLLMVCASPKGGFAVGMASVSTAAAFLVLVVLYLYSSELFPVIIRARAIGVCSVMARIGAMIAPFIVTLKDKAEWMPPLMFAIPPLISALVCMALPETKGRRILQTIEEGESHRKQNTETPQETLRRLFSKQKLAETSKKAREYLTPRDAKDDYEEPRTSKRNKEEN